MERKLMKQKIKNNNAEGQQIKHWSFGKTSKIWKQYSKYERKIMLKIQGMKSRAIIRDKLEAKISYGDTINNFMPIMQYTYDIILI